MPEAGNGYITLLVGERHFNATKDTLTRESEYFKDRLSQRNDADARGAIFIDGDPTLFEAILQYLCTSHPPLFFDSTTQTHDLAKYAALLGEAHRFGIPKLVAWIIAKKYLHVIQVKSSFQVLNETAFKTASLNNLGAPPSTTKLTFFPTSGIRKAIVCPQETLDPGGRHRCSEYCLEQRGSLACTFEDQPYFKMLVIEQTAIFNPEML